MFHGKEPQPDRVFGALQVISLAGNTFIGIGSSNLLNSKLHSPEIFLVPPWQLVKGEIVQRQKFDGREVLLLVIQGTIWLLVGSLWITLNCQDFFLIVYANYWRKSINSFKYSYLK
jgi:hypothetical protein